MGIIADKLRNSTTQASDVYTEMNNAWHEAQDQQAEEAAQAAPSLWDDVKNTVGRIWEQDVYGGIIKPFAEGAEQAFGQIAAANNQQTNAITQSIKDLGSDSDTQAQDMQQIEDASDYRNSAGQEVLNGPAMLVPQIAAPVFVGDAINTAIDEGSVGAGVRAVTYGPLADFASQENLGDRFIEQPITTTGQAVLSALPIGVAGHLGYKGVKGAKAKYTEGMTDFEKQLSDLGEDTYNAPDVAEPIRENEPQEAYTEQTADAIPEEVQPEAPQQTGGIDTGIDSGIDSMVNDAAARNGVDPALLAKLVDQESTYGRDPNAGGNLAQVSDDLAAHYGLDNSDPAQSIEAGARYLKEQLDANGGDAREALAAYNAGPGNKQAGYGYADSVLGRDIGGDIGQSGGSAGGAYEQGAESWMGARMPSGSEGCVEAATRVGSFYDPFLKEEADRGVASVPRLVEDAGDRVIPFDESQLEKGDIIVYGDNDHVVTYDGRGGYVGNSTGQGKIVHGSDYHEMGGMSPTKIIKTSDHTGGNYTAPVDDSYSDSITQEENGRAAANDEDVDILGNKLNDSDVPIEEQMRQDAQESIDKQIPDVNKPADVKWDSSEEKNLPDKEEARQIVDNIINDDYKQTNNAEKITREEYEESKNNTNTSEPAKDNQPETTVKKAQTGAVDSAIEQLKQKRQQMIDEQVQFYKDTPGGKGTDSAPIYDEYGEHSGTVSVSNNPQWYQDAYKYFKGKPPKSRLAEFAEQDLMTNDENFGKLDLQIRRMEEYSKRLKESPDADPNEVAKSVADDIQFSKAIKAEIDKAINDNLPDLKEKDTPAEKPKHSRGPARFVEEQPEKRGFIANDVIPTVKGAVDFAKTAKDEIQRVIAPSTMGKDSKLTAQNMREFLSDMAHKGNTLEHSLGDVQKHFEKHPEQSIPFISKMEHGERMSDPKLQAFADSMRKIMDARAQEVRDLGTGKLEHFIKNYFPHIWKDEEKAGSFSAAWLGKRPFEGKKSFLKKRTVPTIAEGIKAGLEPITRNPADLVIMKMREMDKYIMAHKTMEAERKAGRGKWVRDVQGEEAPDGWKKVDDKIAVKYGPPAVDVREAYDPAIMDTLNHVCDTLNIKHTRDTVLKADGKRVASGTWGYASSDGKIGTKFGGPESVLAHEIGHQLDYKYHVYDIMRSDPTKLRIGNSNKYTTAGKEMQREFEILADKRMDPNDMNNAHRKYVQGGTEPMAAVIEAYVHAPEMLKETAPVIYKSLMKFFKAHPELNDLRDIKPSLRLKENRGEQPINGLVTLGHFYMPAESARLINNYLSPGLRDKSAIFRGYLGIANVMNQFQLGLSAFHLGFTSMDSIVSKMALSIIKASHGDIFSALANTLHVPIAPVETAMRGNKLYKEWMSPGSQGAKEGKLLDSLIAGGGRVKMDKMYQTNMVDTMRKAFRQGNYVGASARIPFALMEMSVKPILEFVVPRQKLGIFADAMQYELKRKPDMTHEELQDVAGRIWNSVDNRLGQLCYDNLFWQKTLKDILMASTRSVGWNLGTWRELGGAAVDAGKYAGKVLKNRSLSSEKTGGITYRMSYAIALPVMVGMLGAIMQYMYTGQGPNDMKDLFYPRTGTLDKNGRPQRIELPSYMKDLAAYYDHPGRTLENKLHPMLSSIADMLHNKDYYGKEIYHKDDDAGKKAIDIMSYLAQQFVPFSVRGSKYNADLGGSFLSKALPFFGITPAPADVNKTEVEKKISEMLQNRMPAGSQTKEQAEKRDLKSGILRDLQMSNGQNRESLNNAYNSRQIDGAERTRLMNEYKLSPLQRGASKIGIDDVKSLLDSATPEEKPILEKIYKDKVKLANKHR